MASSKVHQSPANSPARFFLRPPIFLPSRYSPPLPPGYFLSTPATSIDIVHLFNIAITRCLEQLFPLHIRDSESPPHVAGILSEEN